MLNQIDASGDGEIDTEEFKREVKKMGVAATKEEMDALFISLDADGGGTLDLDEVRKWLRRMETEAEEAKVRCLPNACLVPA